MLDTGSLQIFANTVHANSEASCAKKNLKECLSIFCKMSLPQTVYFSTTEILNVVVNYSILGLQELEETTVFNRLFFNAKENNTGIENV